MRSVNSNLRIVIFSSSIFSILQSFNPSILQFFLKEVQALAEEVVTGVAAKDAVIAVGIDQLTEVLVGLHQRLDILSRVAIVYVVVGQSVTEQ